MGSLKDLERSARLCEKEIETLTDRLAQQEASLKLEVERLRAELDAVLRYLSERDPALFDALRAAGQRGRDVSLF